MFRLERGSTGFRDARGRALTRVEPTLFRAVCFAAAREAGGRLSEVAPATRRTFHSATVTEEHGRRLTVLCHAHLPLIAFTEGPVPPGDPVPGFAPVPVWSDPFRTAGFRLLEADELATPMTRADVTALASTELAEIGYHQPERAGDALFNWWD